MDERTGMKVKLVSRVWEELGLIYSIKKGILREVGREEKRESE